MEKFKTFCSKNHVVVIFALSFLLVLIIESLGRHNPIQAVIFMVQNPLVYLANMALVFSLLSLSMLFKRRVFVTTLLSLVWLSLGITNGVILSNRMTPFTVKDLSNLNEAIAIVENYFSVGTVIGFIALVTILVVGFIFLYRKAPKKPTDLNFKKDLAAVLIVFIGTFGIIQVGQKAGVLDTFFGNLAIGYKDNGVCYSFIITWMDTGIDKPEEYSAQAMKDVFGEGELGDDGIYTPGEDDNLNAKKTPHI